MEGSRLRKRFAQIRCPLTDKERERSIRQIILKAKKEVLGAKHICTLKTYADQSRTCKSLGRFREALLHARMASMGAKANTVYPDNPVDSESFENGHRLEMEYVDQLKTMEGERSMEHAIGLNDMGLVHVRNGKYSEGRICFEQALDIFERKYPEEHKQGSQEASRNAIVLWIGTIYTNLALAIAKGCKGKPGEMSEMNLAQTLYLKSLDVYYHELGPSHPRVHKIVNDLALLYNEIGKREQAKALLVDVMGRIHPAAFHKERDMSILGYNLAKLYEADEEYPRAIEQYKQVHKWYKGGVTANESDRFRGQIQNNISLCLIELGEYEQAIVLLRGALNMLRQNDSGEESSIARTLYHNLHLAEDRGKKFGHIFSKRYKWKLARAEQKNYKTQINFNDFDFLSEQSRAQLYALAEANVGHDEKGYLKFLGYEDLEDKDEKVYRPGHQKSTFFDRYSAAYPTYERGNIDISKVNTNEEYRPDVKCCRSTKCIHCRLKGPPKNATVPCGPPDRTTNQVFMWEREDRVG